MLLDESGEGIKVFGPTGSTKPFPSGLSPVGGIHGPVDAFFFGLAKGGEDLTVGGVFRLEGLPSFRLGDFSVDEQSEAVRLSGDPIEGGLRALGCFPVIHRVQNFLHFHVLSHGVSMSGRVMAGHEMFELSFDVAQQAGRPEAEKVGLEPTVAEFLLHQGEVGEGILGLGNSAGRLVPDPETGSLVVVADLTDHGQADGQGRVHAFLAGRSLDEIGPGHHADEGSPGDVPQGAQFPGCEDGFYVSVPAGFTECFHLVVEGLPILREHVAPGNHDVDLLGPGLDRFSDFRKAERIGRQAGRETG